MREVKWLETSNLETMLYPFQVKQHLFKQGLLAWRGHTESCIVPIPVQEKFRIKRDLPERSQIAWVGDPKTYVVSFFRIKKHRFKRGQKARRGHTKTYLISIPVQERSNAVGLAAISPKS